MKANQLLLDQVEQVIRPYLAPDTRLLVGVSGGPDSLTLLHALTRLVSPDQLIAAHLHHGLRPAADEELFSVLQTAVAWGVACVADRVAVAELAEKEGWSLEEAGRRARYRFLAEVAAAESAAAVLVAHHGDDQAETVLLNLIRGSGVAGLRGMRAVSPLPGRPELVLLRPLLALSRADIEAYCRDNRLQPIHDESNEDTRFLRNRIRQELLPLLSQYNPQIKSHLQQLAAITAADYALMDEWFNLFWQSVFVEAGEGWISLTRDRWLELPLSHKRLALRRAVQTLRPWQTEIGFRPIELAREMVERNVTGAQIDLPGGLRLQVGYHNIMISGEEAVQPAPYVPQLKGTEALTLSVPGQVGLGQEWVLEATLFDGDREAIAANDDPWVAFVDVAADSLQVRTRQAGERFQPLGMHGRSAKVKEVMINRKMAQALRPYWPIVATAEHLVWLVGHHQDERSRVTPTSQTVVQLKCRRVRVES